MLFRGGVSCQPVPFVAVTFNELLNNLRLKMAAILKGRGQRMSSMDKKCIETHMVQFGVSANSHGSNY